MLLSSSLSSSLPLSLSGSSSLSSAASTPPSLLGLPPLALLPSVSMQSTSCALMALPRVPRAPALLATLGTWKPHSRCLEAPAPLQPYIGGWVLSTVAAAVSHSSDITSRDMLHANCLCHIRMQGLVSSVACRMSTRLRSAAGHRTAALSWLSPVMLVHASGPHTRSVLIHL